MRYKTKGSESIENCTERLSRFESQKVCAAVMPKQALVAQMIVVNKIVQTIDTMQLKYLYVGILYFFDPLLSQVAESDTRAGPKTFPRIRELYYPNFYIIAISS